MRLILTIVILMVSWFDMAFTIWAVRRYWLKEKNPIWIDAMCYPVRFVLKFTAYHIAALVICWFTFPLELYWIVLAVRLFVNAKNIYAVRRAR